MNIAGLSRLAQLSGQQLQSVSITKYKVDFLFMDYSLYIEIDTTQQPTDLTVDNLIPPEIQSNLLLNQNDTLDLAVADRGSNAIILQFRQSGTIIIASRANIRVYIGDITASNTSGAEIEIIKTSQTEETITELQYNRLYYDQQCFLLGVLNGFVKTLVPSGMTLDEKDVIMPSVTLLRINVKGSQDSLSQQFKAEYNKEYVISFRIRGNTAITVGVANNNTAVHEVLVTANNSWRDVKINFRWTALDGLAAVYIRDTETPAGFTDITAFSVKTVAEGTELIRNGFFKGGYTKGLPKEKEWVLTATANENDWTFLLPIETPRYNINPWKYITYEALEYFIKLFDITYFDEPIERSITDLWERTKLILNNYIQINWNVSDRINEENLILNTNVAALSIISARDTTADFLEEKLRGVLSEYGENQQVNIGVGIQLI